MEGKKICIIAPHPDDEIIGCSRLFMSKSVDTVLYISDGATILRLEELENFCCSLGVKNDFCSSDDLLKHLKKYKKYRIFVPSAKDHHPLHRKINGMTIGMSRGIYSIDMNTEYVKELSEEDKKIKLEWLNKYYPSQKSLWENDWKYFMFEGTVLEI